MINDMNDPFWVSSDIPESQHSSQGRNMASINKDYASRQSASSPAAGSQAVGGSMYFATFQEASDWSRQNNGMAFTRSSDGNGFAPVATRNTMSAGRPKAEIKPLSLYGDKGRAKPLERRDEWEDEEPPF